MTIIFVLAAVGVLILLAYGMNLYFTHKTNQGKDTSNSTIKRAIGAILIGFLALVGLAPLIADIIIQLLNTIPGINLKETQSSEVIGGLAFLVLSLAIVLMIYFYYRNRHRMYLGKSESTKDKLETKSIIIKDSKNIIVDSEIKGNVSVGDETSISQQIMNNGEIGTQINIQKNEGDINL